MTSAEAQSVAMWRTYEKYFVSAHEFQGVKVLGMYSMSPNNIYCTKPIKNLDDLHGRRIRSNPDGAVYVDAVGGAMVSQQPPMQHELLSRGVVDCTVMPSWGMPMFDSVDLAPYGIAPPGGFSRSTVVMFMNQNKWDALSDADKKAILAVSGEQYARQNGRLMDDMARQADQEIAQKGGGLDIADQQQTVQLDKDMKVGQA